MSTPTRLITQTNHFRQPSTSSAWRRRLCVETLEDRNLLAPLTPAVIPISPSTNLALAPGATAFAQDVIPGYPTIHAIAHLNDGIRGNSKSWIANSSASFAGISFGANPVAVSGVAWGRHTDSTIPDRSLGNYFLEYTQTPNPNRDTPHSAWDRIGEVYYDSSTPSPWLRHGYSFTPVSATGIRLRFSSAFDPNGYPGSTWIAIDELELYGTVSQPPPPPPPAPPPSSPGLTQVVGNFTTINLAAQYGTAFAKDVIPGYPTTHAISHLNDGFRGNARSWIGNSTSSFAGISFGTQLVELSGVAWGRHTDNTFIDRAKGTYTLQYTTQANPNKDTQEGQWTPIGTKVYDDATSPSPWLRHAYTFPAVRATGIRLKTEANDIIAIDELELYGQSTPPALPSQPPSRLSSVDQNATINVVMFDNSLRITGTEGNDEIWVDNVSGGYRVSLNRGSTWAFTANPNRNPVSIYGLGGNDNIRAGFPTPFFVNVSEQNTLTNSFSIDGGAGNDTIFGSYGNDRLIGGLGDDFLEGSDGNDTLGGSDGNDILYGSAGNDLLVGSAGNDYLLGGVPNLTNGNDTLYGDVGEDTLVGGLGGDELHGGAGNDTLWGGDENSFTVLDPNDRNTIYGGAGNDSLNGGLAEDTIFGDDGRDTIRGNLGNDTLDGGLDRNANSILGGDGNDTLYGGPGSYVLREEYLVGEQGDDRIVATETGFGVFASGGTGDDSLWGTAGDDALYGGEGFNRINGRFGNDIANNDGGSGTIINVAGVIVYGTSGNDQILIRWETGEDHEPEEVLHPPFPNHPDFLIVELNGVETKMEYTPHDNGDKPTVIVYGYEGDDFIQMTDYGAGQHWDAEFHGGPGNDTLIATTQLFGKHRSSYLYGEEGDDTLFGGADKSFLVGGPGNDLVIGRSGPSWVVSETGTEADDIREGSGATVVIPRTMTLEDAKASFDQESNPSAAQAQQQFYVQQLYRKLLDRDADIPGLTFWMERLQEGASPAQVVSAITDSVESRTRIVRNAYVNLLNRSADEGGQKAFVAFLGHGGTQEDMKRIILSSKEYLALHGGSNADFLRSLYQEVLSRNADPSGEMFFGTMLSAGADRSQVVDALFDSVEHRARRVDSVYAQVFGRIPDEEGRLYWIEALRQGLSDEGLGTALVRSQEYSRLNTL